MSVSNGQRANQTTFNTAFMSRTVDTSTVGKVDLNNVAHDSITDTQRELNAIARYTGKTINTAATTAPAWTDNTVGASGDSLFDRIEAVQAYAMSSSGGGGGGDYTVVITNFDQTDTAITGVDAQEQIWRFTAESPEAAVTLASFNFSSVPQGGKITFTSQSDSEYPVTIPSNLSNVIMNGDWVGTQYSLISFQRIGPRIIEVCRNGI